MGLASDVGNRLKDGRRWLVLVALAPATALDLRYLSIPVADPTTFPALVIDRSLMLLIWIAFFGLLMVLVAPGGPAALWGVASTSISLAVAVAILIAATRPPRDPAGVVWAAVAAVGALLALRMLLMLYPNPFGLARPKLTLALITGLLLPLLQLWQTTSFAAYTSRVSLEIDPVVSIEDTSARDFRVNVAFTADNKQDVRALVLASDLKFCWWKPGEKIEYSPDVLRNRSNCIDWDPVAWRSWLDAKAPLTVSHEIVVPRSSPHVVVVARVQYARGDRLRDSGRSVTHPALAGCSGEDAYTLEEESRYKALAQPDKWLIYARPGHDRGVHIYVQSGREKSCSAGPSRLYEHYGVSTTSVTRETWLAAKAPAAAPGAASSASRPAAGG